MRQLVSLFVALCIGFAPQASLAVLKGASGGYQPGGTDVAVADGGTGASTAQAAAQNLGVPWNLLSNGIPFLYAATGTMANNGAITLGTALDATYSDGLYILLPAGAVAAGVPAAATWYWCVMSSTTVGTVFNSTYTSGVPVAGTATAFATTGPGAYTGVTAATDSIIISVPGNSLGTQGWIAYEFLVDTTSNANSKTFTPMFGATTLASMANTSALSGRFSGSVANRGATNRQVASAGGTTGGWGTSGAVSTTRGSNDTTAALNFKLNVTKGTATDNAIVAALRVDVTYRP